LKVKENDKKKKPEKDEMGLKIAGLSLIALLALALVSAGPEVASSHPFSSWISVASSPCCLSGFFSHISHRLVMFSSGKLHSSDYCLSPLPFLFVSRPSQPLERVHRRSASTLF